MPYLLIRHKVEDYAKWKPVFDDHSNARKAAGSKGGYLFRNANDGNEVMIVLEVEDLERCRQFVESDDLKETMQKSGVADIPDVYYLEEVDRPSS